jgi:hypothetical protein
MARVSLRLGRAVFGLLICAGCHGPARSRDGGSASDGGADLSAALPADLGGGGDLARGPCPGGMVRVTNRDAGLDFCVDRYEASTVELSDAGERPHSPFAGVGGLTVRAVSIAGVPPQGYISQVEAAAACALAGKRLCSAVEFAQFCRGPDPRNFYPYGGATRLPGACNEGKGSSVARFFGNDPSQWTYAEFNDPRLNQWDGGLAPTGAYQKCVSPWGIYDCVGNLHEWGSDGADANGHGRFRGGFYGDAELNGPGCRYVTSAHELSYHDYSTGFRCCAARAN